MKFLENGTRPQPPTSLQDLQQKERKGARKVACATSAYASRIDKITGLFRKRALEKRRYSAKEPFQRVDILQKDQKDARKTACAALAYAHMG